MTQQPQAKTPEQALEEQSSAKKRPYMKKLEMKPETPSEEFADLTGSKP